MNLPILVWKELRERPGAVLTSGIAIMLGVAALVAIRHVTVFSQREVGRQLESLGANILILPKSASLQDYYAADMGDQRIPEEHAAEILLAGLTGVEKVSPRLCVPAQVDGRDVTVTGILPQSEFKSKSAWQTTTLFQKKHAGCMKVHTSEEADTPDSLASKRTIESLGEDEAVIGADVAEKLEIQPGSAVELLGEKFRVVAVLPPTGTIDDSRVFAHLHTVQKLAKAGEMVSAIEVVGCCEDAAGQLVPELSRLLPDSKVVTISQVVQTQVGVNRLMAGGSLFVLLVLVLVGGTTVMSTMAANVRERRREIGTLMALGATPGLVSRMFLLKAVWLGLAGGILGSFSGIVLAMVLGPVWAGVRIVPLVDVAAVACLVALVLAIVAAYWPARQAARLDPCICFQET